MARSPASTSMSMSISIGIEFITMGMLVADIVAGVMLETAEFVLDQENMAAPSLEPDLRSMPPDGRGEAAAYVRGEEEACMAPPTGEAHGAGETTRGDAW